jgi:diguanylate cyclase (GGDEF)-like protein
MAGALWLTAAASISLGLLIPGAVTRHWQVELVLSGLMALWGVACMLIPPQITGPLTFHIPALLAVPVIAVNIASTGGAHSYLTYDYFSLLAFAAYFFSFRQAIGYAALAGLAVALPLTYDPGAVHDGLLVQIFVVVPAFLVLSVVMAGAKSRLVGLRNAARELSLVDPLTELPNRRAFSERVGAQIGGERASDATGLLLVDLDEFKEINTLHGHPGGDRVLCETAQALRSAAREEDMVSRIGGDEFAIVLHSVDGDGMRRLAERVLEAVRAASSRMSSELPGIRLTASVGWALYPGTAGTLDELIMAADTSLRGAKQSGKDSAVSPIGWAADPA